MKTSIETERLTLKPSSLEDAAFALALYNSPGFLRYIGDRNIRTLADAEIYIKNKFLPQIEKLGFGNYVVSLKDTNEKIGTVGIFEREGLDVMDIGYAFLGNYEGKGYAYEAALALMHYAKEKFGVRKLSAITTEDNYNSQKLILKLGFQYLKNVSLPNDPTPFRYYEKTLIL